MPDIHDICNDFQPKFFHLDFCQFGEFWKKPTSLLASRINLEKQANGVDMVGSAAVRENILCPWLEKTSEVTSILLVHSRTLKSCAEKLHH